MLELRGLRIWVACIRCRPTTNIFLDLSYSKITVTIGWIGPFPVFTTYPCGKPGSEITTTGHSRKIIELAQQLVLRQRLDNTQPKRSAANSATRKTECG